MSKIPDELLEPGFHEGLDVKLTRRKTKGERRPLQRMRPVRRNIDWSPAMYQHIEDIAADLGVTNQALVKIVMQEYIMRYDQHRKSIEEPSTM